MGNCSQAEHIDRDHRMQVPRVRYTRHVSGPLEPWTAPSTVQLGVERSVIGDQKTS